MPSYDTALDKSIYIVITLNIKCLFLVRGLFFGLTFVILLYISTTESFKRNYSGTLIIKRKM